MIEAVNSVLSNASATRVAAEQQSTLRSYAANPEKTQEVAQAPYVSPYISIDRNYNKAVLQIRDSDTGDVLRQYPTEGQLKAYRTAQQFSQRQETKAQQTDVHEFSSGSEGVSVPQPQVTPEIKVDTTPTVSSVEQDA